MDGARAQRGRAFTPLVGRALDEPAERDGGACLVESGEQLVIKGRNDEAGGDLLPAQRDSQRLNEALAQARTTRAGLDLQIDTHLLSVGEGECVSRLGDTLETIGVGEPAARV